MRKMGLCRFNFGIRHPYLTQKFFLVCHLILCLCLTVVAQQDESQIKFLMGQLNDEDIAVRSKAAKKLGAFGHKSQIAIPLLIDSLNDESRYVRPMLPLPWGVLEEMLANQYQR